MKKSVLLFISLFCFLTTFAQEIQKEGDDFAAAEDFENAAVMYRLCMESEEQCLLKYFKLIYDGKIESQFTDELYQLIKPLAEEGHPEAQYYMGLLYRRGIGGVSQDDAEAVKWLQKSANQNFEDAGKEIVSLFQKLESTESSVDKSQYKTGSLKLSNTLFIAGGVAAVVGIAATYLSSPNIENDYSQSSSTHTYTEVKKRNPAFMVVGGVAGGACIGTGFYFKAKERKQQNGLTSEQISSHSPANRNKDICLNIITTGNGAGLRLTF